MRMKLYKLLMEAIVWTAFTISEVFLRFKPEDILEMCDMVEEAISNDVIDVVTPVVLKKRKKYERKLNKRKES